MRCLVLLLLVLAAGCTIPTGPEYQTNTDTPVPFGLFDIFQYPIPSAHYSGIFVAIRYDVDDLDSSGIDSSYVQYYASVFFYNRLGNLITPSSFDSIKIDDSSPFIPHDLHFPSSVSWSMKGDPYFTSFSHSIASESPVEILSPANQDSIIYDNVTPMTYSAPGADSVTITQIFEGIGQLKGDSAIDSNLVGGFREYPDVNSGSYKIIPFFLDTNEFKFFTPTKLILSIAWAQGDTIHVQNEIYGFVTEVSHRREFLLKK